jgi:DNA-binding transcriptional LysR family regulator
VLDYRLQVFREVAQEQSLSRAARLLHISQPAVTQHIQALEGFFKTALFLRSSSGVTLTAAGVLLLEHARRVSDLTEELNRKLSAQGGTLAGRLRLGASTTITQYFLPDVLVAIKVRHPAVQIEVSEGNSDAVIGSLLARRIDLGLIEAPCRRRDLRVRSFYEDEIIVIAPAAHRWAARAFIPLSELVREPMIFREVGSGTRGSIELALRQRKVVLAGLPVVQELPSTEAIKRMVQLGAGIGFVSALSVRDEVKAGSLVQVKVRGFSIRRPFSAILPLGPDPVGLSQLLLRFLAPS